MFRPQLGLLAITLLCIAMLGFASTFACLPAQVAAAPFAQGQAAITSPQSNTPVVGTLQIMGSATHADFQRYELAWADEPNTTDTWIVFATIDSQVENGVLGTWNTTQMPDGLYSLRLRVVRRDGNYDEIYVRGVQVANSQPSPTPTQASESTATAQPTQATPGAQPTGTTELIVQPPTSTPAPPTATPATNDESTVDTLSRFNPATFSVNVGILGDAFCNGIRYTLLLFFVWGGVLAARGLARWALRHLQKPPAR